MSAESWGVARARAMSSGSIGVVSEALVSAPFLLGFSGARFLAGVPVAISSAVRSE